MAKQNVLSSRLHHLIAKRRENHKKSLQSQLRNTTPTIIGNDCTCGMIYRDLNLPYLSPTVNVLIPPDDFFELVRDLPHYLTCPLEETTLEGADYPVGILKNKEKQVLLHFLHDHSFEEAKDKWIRRCSRVQWDNLYIIFHLEFPKQRIRLSQKNKWHKKFKNISYPRKRMLTNAWFSFDKEIVPLPKQFFFKGMNLLVYPTKYSKKRLLDQFNYVRFFNNKK